MVTVVSATAEGDRVEHRGRRNVLGAGLRAGRDPELPAGPARRPLRLLRPGCDGGVHRPGPRRRLRDRHSAAAADSAARCGARRPADFKTSRQGGTSSNPNRPSGPCRAPKSSKEENTVDPAWRKSSRSFSNGNCVEVAAWRRPGRCNHGECVEVGHGPSVIGVRDSKNPGGPVLHVTPRTWQAFLRSLTGQGRQPGPAGDPGPMPSGPGSL